MRSQHGFTQKTVVSPAIVRPMWDSTAVQNSSLLAEVSPETGASCMNAWERAVRNYPQADVRVQLCNCSQSGGAVGWEKLVDLAVAFIPIHGWNGGFICLNQSWGWFQSCTCDNQLVLSVYIVAYLVGRLPLPAWWPNSSLNEACSNLGERKTNICLLIMLKLFTIKLLSHPETLSTYRHAVAHDQISVQI